MVVSVWWTSPRMSGFTLTEKIRSDSRLAKIPVVLVTSLDSPEDETHGYAVGADAYVVKSGFEKGEFISLIRRFIPENKTTDLHAGSH